MGRVLGSNQRPPACRASRARAVRGREPAPPAGSRPFSLLVHKLRICADMRGCAGIWSLVTVRRAGADTDLDNYSPAVERRLWTLAQTL